ncbi:MAG: T9SS type A sorting domain-containing protein [Cyclobacteriaceae bacterium]
MAKNLKVLKYCLAVLFILAASIISMGQNYVSSGAGSGAWNDPLSWTPNGVPTSASGTITLNHAITVTDAARNGDQMTISGSGSLTINSGITFTVSAGTGDDLTIASGGLVTINNTGTLQIQSIPVPPPPKVALIRVFGRINNLGTISNASSTTLIFESGSVYDHQYTTSAGAIPSASWDSNSTCQITGYTSNSSAPSGLGQAFGNFTIDTPSLAAYIDLNGALTTVNGNLLIQNIPSSYIYITSTTNYTLNIGGNFTIDNSYFGLNSTATATINVTGNVLFSNNNDLNPTFDGDVNFNVAGNFEFQGGTTNLTYGGAGNIPINLGGNFTLSSSPTINNGGTGTYLLSFNGSGTQTFNASQELTDYSFLILNGSRVDLTSGNFLSGPGSFTLQAGATLGVGSANGLVTGGSSGNIRVAGTRTYTANSNIIYNGATQNLGNEWSASGALNGVAVNLELTNGTVVTNNNIGSTSLVGVLTLTNGRFNIGNSNTLNIQGIFNSTGSGTIGGSTTSNLTFSGSGIMGNLNLASGATSLNNLTISRTETLILGTDLLVEGAISLTNGDLDISSRTLTMNGSSIGGGRGLISNSSSNLTFGGSTYSGAVPFQGSGNQLSDLTFATPGGAFTWNSAVTINNNVTLSAGTITHSSGLTMGTNSTFIRSGGSLTITDLDVVTSYNVTYTGSVTTGLELPSSATELNNLTINSSGSVTMDKNITVNGNVNLQGSTLVSGGFNVTMAAAGGNWNRTSGSFSGGTGTVIIAGNTTIVASGVTPSFSNITVNGSRTLTFPTGNINIGGNLVNNGTITPSTSTAIFNGTTTISGSSATSLNNVTVSNSLVAPSVLNIAGNFVNNGTFNSNNGSITFNGNTTVSGSNQSNLFNVTIAGILTAPSSTSLGIAGNLTFSSGTFNSNNGTVLFNGTVAAQSVTGSALTFNNIIVSNGVAPGLSINNTSRLNGTLTLLGSGKFDADGSGSGVFIVSSTSQTAGGRIANLTTPGNLVGDVTVERYIHGKTGGDYRYLAVPVTNGHLGMWVNNIGVTGNFSDRSTNPPFNNILNSGNTDPSVQTYNSTTQAYSDVNGAGGLTSATSLSNAIGYAAYDYLDGAVTASYRGPIGKGSVAVTISSTNNNFNLVPNPYPSTMDWDNVTKTNVNNAMYLRVDPSVFSSYVGGVASNEPFVGWTGEVATGQSFWVTSNGSGSTLTFKEGDKTGNQFYFLRTKAADNYFRMSLISSTGVKDESVLRFADEGTDGFDAEFDAIKLRNGSDPYLPMITKSEFLNLSTYLDGDKTEFAINTIGKLNVPKIVRMNIADVKLGAYSLSFSDLSLMYEPYNIVLVDTYLNKETDISEGTIYEFKVNQNLFSYGSDRFHLRINGEPARELELINDGIRVFPNPTTDFIQISLTPDQESSLKSIALVDLIGNTIVNSESDSNLLQPGIKTIDMRNQSTGLYILNIKYGDRLKSTKIIKK